MPRIVTLPVLALLALVAGGCVSIKSQSASQRLPGFVTLRLDLCVSDRDGSTYADCDPGRNTAEGDNGLDGDEESGRGQLLVGFRPGRDDAVGPGSVAELAFEIENADGGGLGARTVALAAGSNLPGATAVPTARSVSVPANGTASATVRVAVPAGTPLGTYTVALVATSGGVPELRRSNTATITVVDRSAPAIRVNRPAGGATYVTGELVTADSPAPTSPTAAVSAPAPRPSAPARRWTRPRPAARPSA